jgi:hypothetical protein
MNPKGPQRRTYGSYGALIQFLGGLLWLIGWVMSIETLWGAPAMAGLLAYFCVMAGFFDTVKGCLGQYRAIFSKQAKTLPLLVKFMLVGVLVSTAINGFVVIRFFASSH